MSRGAPGPQAFTLVSARAPFDPPRRFPPRLGRKAFWALAIVLVVLLNNGVPGLGLMLLAAAGAALLWWRGRKQADAAASGLTSFIHGHFPDAPAIGRKELTELLQRGRLSSCADDGTELALRLKRRRADTRPQLQMRFRPAGLGLPEFDDALRSFAGDPQVARAMDLLRQSPRDSAA